MADRAAPSFAVTVQRSTAKPAANPVVANTSAMRAVYSRAHAARSASEHARHASAERSYTERGMLAAPGATNSMRSSLQSVAMRTR